MVQLFQVYGTRPAANPHARNWYQTPLPSPRLGNRATRRAMRARLRKARTNG